MDEKENQIMLEQNKQKSRTLIVPIVLATLFLVTIIIIFFVVDFGGDSDEEAAEEQEETKETDVPAVAVDDFEIRIKDSVLRSVDGGGVFEQYFDIVASKEIGTADVLSISFHPSVPDKVIVTTYEDGLFINSDKVNKWIPVDFPPKQIYSFILDRENPDDKFFASGVVNRNGRIFRSDNAGENWRAVYSEPGEGTYVSALAQNPKDPDIMLAGTNYGTIIKSIDGGDTWKNVGSKISGNLSTFTFDSQKRSFVYLLSYNYRIYHSADSGDTWKNWEEEKALEVQELAKTSKQAAIDLANRNRNNAAPGGIIYIVADPNKAGTIYAGTTRGLYRSTDSGKYWYKINIIESAEGFPIPSIAINKNDSNEIVFVAGKSFYKSTNYGETWAVAPLDNSRRASFVSYDPFDSDTIFIGTSNK